MTRQEVVRHIVLQARSNGFDFRAWYRAFAAPEWLGFDEAIDHLCQGRNCYSLLFSHEFASNFWKPGGLITFQVPTQTFTRKMADGTIGTVTRKGYTRRSAREAAWRYHLRELALADDPLRYMRRYLRVEEEVEEEAPIVVVGDTEDSETED